MGKIKTIATPVLEVPMVGNLARNITDPPTGVVDIFPDDNADFREPIRAFEVTVAGDVCVVMVDGSSKVLPARQPGVRYTGIICRIKATGTTATGIFGWL